MSLALSFISMLPVTALVALVLASMKRDDAGEIVRVAARHWGWLVGGLVVLAGVVQVIGLIVQ